MKYAVEISAEAKADLRGIFEYIAFQLLSPENASNQIDRLEKAIFVLREYPQRFKAYDKEPWKSRGLRVMPVDNYLVFYIPMEGEKKVSVVRIMYSGRDIEHHL